MLNDAAARMARDGEDRVHAMATVPMNDPAEAAKELRRASEELGLVGVEIGTSAGTRQLDSPISTSSSQRPRISGCRSCCTRTSR